MPAATRARGRTFDAIRGRLGDLRYLSGLVTQTGQMASADYNQFSDLKRVLKSYANRDIPQTRILEVGCGWHAGVTVLLHTAGAQAVGIDVMAAGPRANVFARSAWKQAGAARMLRRTARRVLVDRSYYRSLAELYGAPLKFANLDIRQMNASAMTFLDESFDFVYSNAVFEHILDVSSAAREIGRVLAKGGIAFISIHLFPSISGGHSPDWVRADEPRRRYVPPWDHLRANRYPPGVTLNRLRERDYLRAFGANLEIADTISTYEGGRYLTPEIQQELPDYTRDELLKANLKVIVRKS